MSASSEGRVTTVRRPLMITIIKTALMNLMMDSTAEGGGCEVL